MPLGSQTSSPPGPVMIIIVVRQGGAKLPCCAGRGGGSGVSLEPSRDTDPRHCQGSGHSPAGPGSLQLVENWWVASTRPEAPAAGQVGSHAWQGAPVWERLALGRGAFRLCSLCLEETGLCRSHVQGSPPPCFLSSKFRF